LQATITMKELKKTFITYIQWDLYLTDLDLMDLDLTDLDLTDLDLTDFDMTINLDLTVFP